MLFFFQDGAQCTEYVVISSSVVAERGREGASEGRSKESGGEKGDRNGTERRQTPRNVLDVTDSDSNSES